MTSGSDHGKAATVYLHFPCFDGIVSGALAILWLGHAHGSRFDSIHPVNYDLQPAWLDIRLPRRSCVVDFLYHPQAEFWCDHHATAFLNSSLRADFEARDKSLQMFDPESPSSARLLWKRGVSVLRTGRLEEMVNWADRIDAADYDDVNQALFGTEPALQITRSLAIDADQAYCDLLVRALCVSSLHEVAAHPDVQRRVAKADELNQEGLRRVNQRIDVRGDIAVFDVRTENASVNRYSAFYLRPQARYSIGTFRSDDSVAVRVNANPWLQFRSPNLGEMMRAAAESAGLGCAGGGHRRVGSLRLDKASESAAETVVQYLIKKLHGDLKSKERSQWQ